MTDPAATVPRYPIRAVSKLTGIGIDTLRAWERRYGAVAPSRDHRGRLYSDADIARLRLLQEAVTAGHSVGRIATLGNDELQRLETRRPARLTRRADSLASPPPSSLDTSSFRTALSSLDSAALDHEMARYAAALPPMQLVTDVLFPAARDVGDAWNRTRGGIAHEHVLSSTMRHLLGSFLRLHARPDPGTRVLFTTPSGDRHEIGILGAAMLAASRGFGVSYLGPDLPATEIVEAVKAARVQVLVLGLTLTDTDTSMAQEMREILRDVPAAVEIWAGGRGAAWHASLLMPRVLLLSNFDDFLRQLDQLQSRVRNTPGAAH